MRISIKITIGISNEKSTMETNILLLVQRICISGQKNSLQRGKASQKKPLSGRVLKNPSIKPDQGLAIDANIKPDQGLRIKPDEFLAIDSSIKTDIFLPIESSIKSDQYLRINSTSVYL